MEFEIEASEVVFQGLSDEMIECGHGTTCSYNS